MNTPTRQNKNLLHGSLSLLWLPAVIIGFLHT